MHRRSHPVPGAFIVALLLAALCLQPAGIVIAQAPEPLPAPAGGLISAHPGGGVEPAEPDILSQTLLEPKGGFMYGRNLLGTGTAESDTPGQVPWGWTVVPAGSLRVGEYGKPGMPMPADPGPADRGSKLFYTTGPACDEEIIATWADYDLTDPTMVGLDLAAVDRGLTPFRLSGWLGGPADSENVSELVVIFLDKDGRLAGPVRSVATVKMDELSAQSGMLYKSHSGILPPGTRSIRVEYRAYHPMLEGGCPPRTYADNLWFSIDQPLPANQLFLPALAGGTKPAKPLTPPPAPTEVKAAASGYSGITVTWKPASGATGYRLERSVNGGVWSQLAYLTAEQTTYLDRDFAFNGHRFPFGQQLAYRVSAVNEAGFSPAVSTSLTAPPEPAAIPDPPASCGISSLTPYSVVFSWTDSSAYEEAFAIYLTQTALGVNNHLLANVEPNGTGVTIVDLTPQVTTTLAVSAWNQAGESARCQVTFTPPAASAGSTYLRWTNAASYPIVSLIVDGVQQFPVYPQGILPGSYYEMAFEPGMHEAEISLGWWDSETSRFLMYTYVWGFEIREPGEWELPIKDPSIQDLMTQFSQEGYWEGYFFDANMICRTAAFRFKKDGSYRFYVSNQLQGQGAYQQVSRDPNIFTVQFKAGDQVGLLVETHGYFYMQNGPASWKQITYTYKPQGYVYNPFCP